MMDLARDQNGDPGSIAPQGAREENAQHSLGYSVQTDHRPARRRVVMTGLGWALLIIGVCTVRPSGRLTASVANEFAIGCIVAGVTLLAIHRRRRKRWVPPFWKLQMVMAVVLALAGLLSAVMEAQAGLWAEMVRWPWRASFSDEVLMVAVGVAWYVLCELGYRRAAARRKRE